MRFALFLAAFAIVGVAMTLAVPIYKNCAVLSPTYNFMINWTVNGSTIFIGLQVKSRAPFALRLMTVSQMCPIQANTSGYMAIGFSKTGNMPGSDAYVVGTAFF